MKLIETLINIIFIVIILVVIYLLYKFLKDPIGAASKTVDSRFTPGKKDRLLFGFINLDEGFAGSKTILNKISGGRLFPTVEQQREQRISDVGIRLPRLGEQDFTFDTRPAMEYLPNPLPKNGISFRDQAFIDRNRDGIDDRDQRPYRLRFR